MMLWLTNGSDSGQFLKVIQIFLVKVPNESAILEHPKNMHFNGFTCNSLEIQPFEVMQLSHQFLAKNGIKSDTFS